MVELPKEKKPIRCKWVYTINGSLERYKVKLVIKSNTLTYGVDYQGTFAPVAKMNTVRVLLLLATNFG